mgnify:CR=1 FL=1
MTNAQEQLDEGIIKLIKGALGSHTTQNNRQVALIKMLRRTILQCASRSYTNAEQCGTSQRVVHVAKCQYYRNLLKMTNELTTPLTSEQWEDIENCALPSKPPKSMTNTSTEENLHTIKILLEYEFLSTQPRARPNYKNTMTQQIIDITETETDEKDNETQNQMGQNIEEGSNRDTAISKQDNDSAETAKVINENNEQSATDNTSDEQIAIDNTIEEQIKEASDRAMWVKENEEPKLPTIKKRSPTPSSSSHEHDRDCNYDNGQKRKKSKTNHTSYGESNKSRREQYGGNSERRQFFEK